MTTNQTNMNFTEPSSSSLPPATEAETVAVVNTTLFEPSIPPLYTVSTNDTTGNANATLSTLFPEVIGALPGPHHDRGGSVVMYIFVPVALIALCALVAVVFSMYRRRRLLRMREDSDERPFVAGAQYNWEVHDDPEDWERCLLDDGAVYRPTTTSTVAEPLTVVPQQDRRPRLMLDLGSANQPRA